MENIFIDATQTPLGRIASHAAKKALRGSKVFIFNSEKAIISGNKKDAVLKWKERRAKGGTALKGPYHSSDTEKILKRAIRGMLPDYRRGRGKEAFGKIRCYNGIPEEYKKEKIGKIESKAQKKEITLKELKQKL